MITINNSNFAACILPRNNKTNIINHLNQQIMTKTLKPICPETPILYGEDARRFLKKIKNPKKLSDERRKEFMDAYKAVMSVFVD